MVYIEFLKLNQIIQVLNLGNFVIISPEESQFLELRELKAIEVS
jgi:hypothetical protein